MILECKPCLSVDVLSAIAAGKRCRRSIPAIRKTVLEACSHITRPVDPWTLSTLLSGHLAVPEIERLSLRELTACIPGWMRDCEPLAASAEQVEQALKTLESNGFEDLYRAYCLPVLEEWAERLTASIHNLQLGVLREDLMQLSSCKSHDSLCIYVSYFAYPNRFLLSDKLLVASCRMGGRMEPGPLVETLIHEMLHGTIPQQPLFAYEALCASDPFLHETREQLSACRAGLVEEEFVVGLSQYICAANGLITDSQALEDISSGCGYTMPLAAILFDALRRYGELPEDLESWLLRLLSELAGSGVRDSVESVSPGYARGFERVNRRMEPPVVRSFLL